MKILLLLFFTIALSFGGSFQEDAARLAAAGSFAEKQSAIEALCDARGDETRLKTLLIGLQEGAIYAQNGAIYMESNGEFRDFFSGEKIEFDPENAPKKISINNRLRGAIEASLNEIALSDPDASVRLEAAKAMLPKLSEKDRAIVDRSRLKEKDPKVQKALDQAHAILAARYDRGDSQLTAVKNLAKYWSPYAIQTLKSLRESAESDELKSAIDKSLGSLESVEKANLTIRVIFEGLSLGSVLLLAAIGLAITFGVMKVINMAHGELIMLGAYSTFVVQQLMPNAIEYSIFVAIPVAFLVSGAVGVLIERLILRRLYARPLEALLATFGVGLILQQLMRTIFGATNRRVESPDWLSGSFEINSFLSITYNRFYILIFALIVFAATLAIINKTSLGLKVCALSQNRRMARAMGIKTGFVDAMTFGIGSGIAGVAGVALSQLTNVGPNLGQDYIVDSFMVVVFGGVGNLWGTLISAFALGEINKTIETIFGSGLTTLAKVLTLVLVIIFIQKRPRGLFPQKGRDAED